MQQIVTNCNTLMNKGSAFRNLGQNYIYIPSTVWSAYLYLIYIENSAN